MHRAYPVQVAITNTFLTRLADLAAPTIVVAVSKQVKI